MSLWRKRYFTRYVSHRKRTSADETTFMSIKGDRYPLEAFLLHPRPHITLQIRLPHRRIHTKGHGPCKHRHIKPELKMPGLSLGGNCVSNRNGERSSGGGQRGGQSGSQSGGQGGSQRGSQHGSQGSGGGSAGSRGSNTNA